MHINIYFQDDLRKIQFSNIKHCKHSQPDQNLNLAIYIKTYNLNYSLQNPVELHYHINYNHNNGQLIKSASSL